MSWLDQFLLAVRSVASSGTALPQRAALNFTGAGVVVSDDEANDSTVVTIAGGSGISALTGDVTASGSGSVAATVARLQGRSVASTAPTDGQVLTYSASGSQWLPVTPSGGAIKTIQIQGTNAYGTINAGTPVCAWGTSDGAVIPATCAWSGSFTPANLFPIGIAINTSGGGDPVDIVTFGEATLPSGIATNSVPIFAPYSAGLAKQFGAIGASGPYRVIKLGTMISNIKAWICIYDMGIAP